MRELDNFVVGFLRSYDLSNWLLINKGLTTTPNGVQLKWCGIGGKVVPGEKPHQAMTREFLEETGYRVIEKRWHCFHIKDYINSRIYCFDCPCSPDEFSKVSQHATDLRYMHEGPLGLHMYPDICFSPENYTFDLRYLIPMIILESQRGMLLQLDPTGVNSEFKRSIGT